jgi:steroid delta-isomerase-like uncharacterized protein
MANLENEKVVRRFYEVFNKQDPSILKEVISEDYTDYGHQPPGRGVQGALGDYQSLTKSFSDVSFNIEQIISLDDVVIARWSGSAKNVGEILGFPATQKTAQFTGMSFYKLRDGKIIETRNAVDFLAPLIQLGLVVPGSSKAA